MPARPLVLCFHSISSTWQDDLAVPPADLERYVVSFLEHGYRPAVTDEIIAGREKLLHVTFDDALAGVVDAADVLQRLGVPATVFVCSAYAEAGGRRLEIPELARVSPSELETLSWEELRSLVARGIEIGSHGVTHAHLTRLDDEQLREELESSRLRIEEELGRPCRFLAYPFGESDPRVHEAARKAGYEVAFGLPGNRSWTDLFDLPRVGVWRGERTLRVRLKASRLGRIAAGMTSRAAGV